LSEALVGRLRGVLGPADAIFGSASETNGNIGVELSLSLGPSQTPGLGECDTRSLTRPSRRNNLHRFDTLGLPPAGGRSRYLPARRRPASATVISPVIFRDVGPARNMTTSATSSAVDAICNGTIVRTASRNLLAAS